MKIVITESQNFSDRAIYILNTIGNVEVFDCKTEDDLISTCSDADVIFVRLRHRLTKSILSQCNKLQYVLTATTGTDHIDEHYFLSQGGKVISLKGETDFLDSIPSTAEHTFALILALLKKIPASFESVKNNVWNRDLFKGNNLSKKKIGILGLGRVGNQVARIAQGFSMEVGYYDTEKKECSFQSFKTPEELFEWGDIISLHIPYNKANHQYVGSKMLRHLDKDKFIINTSRGNIWDENNVAEKIIANEIAGVATDVISNEFDPLEISNNKLIHAALSGKNVILTPHVAGATFESMEMTEIFIATKFLKLYEPK